jgi:DNA replication licensing factor MCM6
MLAVVGQVGGQGRGDAVVSSGREGASGGEGVGGLKKLGCKEMSFKTVFVASGVEAGDRGEGERRKEGTEEEEGKEGGLSAEEVGEVREMRRTPDLYRRMAACIAPGIFGHVDIKRG